MTKSNTKSFAWYQDCPPIVEDFKLLAKSKGIKVEDNNQTIMYVYPSGFRVMISRVSQVVQCYYLECGWDHSSHPLSKFSNAESIWDYTVLQSGTLSTDVKEMRKRINALTDI